MRFYVTLFVWICSSYQLFAQGDPDLQFLYYSNANEKISHLYFIDSKRAIGIKSHTQIVLLENGLIIDQFDATALHDSKWETVRQVVVTGDDRFILLTLQLALPLRIVSGRIQMDSDVKVRKFDHLQKVFEAKSLGDIFSNYCVMGTLEKCTFGYYIQDKVSRKGKVKKEPAPPLYWVYWNNTLININENTTVVTNDRFYNDWLNWTWRYDKLFTFANDKLYLISPEANKMYEFNTASGFHRAIAFPDLNGSKSWYFFYDRMGKQAYLVNKLTEKRFVIYAVSEELSFSPGNLVQVKEVDFLPKSIIDSHIQKQVPIDNTDFSEHYLVPLYGYEQKNILNEVKVKDH